MRLKYLAIAFSCVASSPLAAQALAPHPIVPQGLTCPSQPSDTAGPPPGTPYIEATADRDPKLIKAGPHTYPADLQGTGIKGTVVLAFVVDTLGRSVPCSFQVVSATDAGFEQAALQVVLASRYRPAELRKQKVRAIMYQTVTFKP